MTSIQATVILPTYNESENLKVIIPNIAKVLNEAQISFEILVVDDNSPDQTAQIAEGLAGNYPVRVNCRKTERGLATAVMEGFRLSVGEVAVVMDADQSHPVEKLPEMILPILNRACDITVGSRYVAGGGCSTWPWYRQVISRGAGLLAFGLTKLTDPTSGFMGVRRSLLDGLKLTPVGWKIVLEVITKASSRDKTVKVKEVPIVFFDRVFGESKLTAEVQLQYLQHIWKLYDFTMPNLWQLIKFCLVGASGMVIDTLALVSAVELSGYDPRIATSFSFFAAVTWNFVLDRSWTFRAEDKGFLTKFFQFVLICICGLAIRIYAMDILLDYTVLGTGRLYILANFFGIILGTTVNFLGSKFLVFRKK